MLIETLQSYEYHLLVEENDKLYIIGGFCM